MHRKPLLALALVATLLPAFSVARAQTVDEVLAKHYEAQGGLEKLKAIQTLRMTGRMAMGPGMEAPIVIEKKRPSKSRLDFSFNGMTGTQVYDGSGGWTLMPFMGQTSPTALSPEESKEMAERADFDGPLVDWKEKGNTVELAGKEAIEGADAFKLKLTNKSGKVTWYYLDAETYLIVKEAGKRMMRGTEIDGESYLSDYKDVNGLMMPFTTTQGMKDSDRKQVMSIDKIEINVPIDDSRFAMPVAAAAAPDTTKAAPPKDAKAAAKPAAKKGK